MKKLFSILFAVMLVLGTFAGCTSREVDYEIQDATATKPEYLNKQSEIIGTFGSTQENARIVGYKHNPDYYEYIVVKYNEKGIKVWERVYNVYYNLDYYANAKEEFKDAKNAEFNDEAAVIVFTTQFANTGLYSSDLAKVKTTYTLR